MMNLLAIAVKVIPLILHTLMLMVFLHNRKQYFRSSFYTLVCILTATIITETTSSLLAYTCDWRSSFEALFFLLSFLEVLTDSYTPCIILLIGLHHLAVFSRGFLHDYLRKINSLLVIAFAFFLLSTAWSLVAIVVTYSSIFPSAETNFSHFYSVINVIFHLLAVLSFLFYLAVFIKMHTSNSIISVHTTLSNHFMKAEKVNLLQGFAILMAYTSTIVIDFMDGSVVDWEEYPAYLVREIAEGVTGFAIPIMVFICSHNFRTDAAKLFVFWRR